MATGPINNNPYIQQILTQNLSSSNIQPKQLKNSAQLISSAFTAKSSISTISSSGSKINKISNQIRESGDLEAFSGFQSALQQATTGSDPLKTIRLVNSASYLANTSPETLNQSFSNVNRISSQYGEATGNLYVDTMIATTEKAGAEGVSQLNRAVGGVENADYSNSGIGIKDNLSKLFSAVREINLAGQSKEEISGELTRLAKGIELSDSGDSIWNYFNEFIGAAPDAEPA